MLSALGVTFFATMIIGVPIAFCLGLAGLVAMLVWGKTSLILIPQRMFTGVDSFVLMAVPLFMLAGELMGTSCIIARLVRFADVLVGWIRGGLAHVNIVSAMILSGVSGSAVADASALGSTLIPAMRDEYDAEYGAAVCASAAAVGPIIPPSIAMVVYAITSNVSVAGLFMAGVIPGVLMGVGMMAIAYVIARRRGYHPRTERIPWPEVRRRFLDALPALVAPVIIVGGILLGVVTPTEAGALGVFYAVVVGFLVTRELRWADFPPALLRSGITTGVVFILIATANVVSWLLTVAQVPLLAGQLVRSLSDSPWVFLLIVNLLLLLVGCFLDNIAAMIMLVPILAPIATSYGIDPLHFGFVFVMNGVIGMLTPPFGILLFVVCGIARVPLTVLSRAVLPYVAWQIVVLSLCTYVPPVALWIPRLLGYVS
ncbi:MAG TPA: TRAP transporter large permease [Methylomirabilota bacterium]|nr:TRAP transporter large permease [Methylomirabilota bacterium]